MQSRKDLTPSSVSKDSKILLRCYFPRWALIFICYCGLASVISLPSLAVIYFFKTGSIPTTIIAIFIFIFLGSIWLFSFLFSCLLVTESGLEYINPFKKHQFCTWEEIIEVKRPAFKIPHDYVYVISKTGKNNITLIRGLGNYRELTELIVKKSPNLKSYEF